MGAGFNVDQGGNHRINGRREFNWWWDPEAARIAMSAPVEEDYDHAGGHLGEDVAQRRPEAAAGDVEVTGGAVHHQVHAIRPGRRRRRLHVGRDLRCWRSSTRASSPSSRSSTSTSTSITAPATARPSSSRSDMPGPPGAEAAPAEDGVVVAGGDRAMGPRSAQVLRAVLPADEPLIDARDQRRHDQTIQDCSGRQRERRPDDVLRPASRKRERRSSATISISAGAARAPTRRWRHGCAAPRCRWSRASATTCSGRRRSPTSQSQGIDASHVRIVAGASSGVAPIFVESNGQNRIIVVKGANDRLLPADVDEAHAVLEAADCIVLQFEIPLETVYHTVRFARSAASAASSTPRRRSRSTSRRSPASTTSCRTRPRPRRSPACPCGRSTMPKRARRTWCGRGCSASSSRSARRARWSRTRAARSSIAPYRVATKDTTGAGDAFVGSFAVFLGEGLSERDAIARANLYAALSTTGVGTQKSFVTRQRFDDEWQIRAATGPLVNP